MKIYRPVFLIFLAFHTANAHFQVIMPEDDVLKENKSSLRIEYKFMHPFEQTYLQMDKPIRAGVLFKDKIEDITKNLVETKIENANKYETKYEFKKPGDYIFFVEQSPYFEKSEEKFIKQISKTIINAFGMEDGWDTPIGLKAEIMPLTRPNGVWSGNIFVGQVLFKGKPVPNARVEVEYYNKDKIDDPTGIHSTQVIKTDNKGVFYYAIPKAGWWGFAAILEDDKKLKGNDNKEYPVELGAVFWLKAYEIK